MRTKAERRYLTERKLRQRELLAKNLGLQQGTLYQRHRDKISMSSGYMRDGNVTHYVAAGFHHKPKRQKIQDIKYKGGAYE